MIRHFKTVCLSGFLVGLAIVHHPADTFHVELVRASAHISYARKILRSCVQSHLAIACTIKQTIFLVGLGFEPLAMDAIYFCGSRGLNPCPCSTIFLWVQGLIPWPWLPVLGLVYPWPMSLAPTNGATGGTAEQKKLLLEVKNYSSAWVVALAVWRSRKVSTCD